MAVSLSSISLSERTLLQSQASNNGNPNTFAHRKFGQSFVTTATSISLDLKSIAKTCDRAMMATCGRVDSIKLALSNASHQLFPRTTKMASSVSSSRGSYWPPSV